MYFGVPIWTIVHDHPYDKGVDIIAELGFKGIELIAWNGDVLRDYYTKETTAALKKQIEGNGMTLSNFNFTVRYICDDDPKVRQQNLDDFKRATEVAKELGAANMTSVSPYPFSLETGYNHPLQLPTSQIWTTNVDMNRDWVGNYELFVENLRTCCEYAAQAGLWLCIEPHPFRWVNSASSMLRLIDKVGADNLGFNLDPSHLFPSGDLPQLTVYQMKGRLQHTHFSDNDSFTNAHWRPGKGKIDWYAVMKALKDIGYDGVISFELEDVPGSGHRGVFSNVGMGKELRLSMKYIREIADELDMHID